MEKMEEKDLQNQVETGVETPESKTFTQEEVDKMLQAETDRKTTKALQTAKEKWEAEFKEKLAAEKSEAEKLATMTAEERTKAELDAQKAAFEQERQSFLKEKLELQTIKELSAEGLPTEFSTYVMAESAEDTSNNIKAFKSEWQKAIEAAIDERLKGRTPSASNTSGAAITKEQFNKMGYKERAKLIEENPELYQELRG